MVFCFEGGKEGSKGIGVFSLNQERKDAKRGRIGLKIFFVLNQERGSKEGTGCFVFEPGKEGCKD